MKKHWMDTRIKMLQSMMGKMESKEKRAIAVENFLTKMKQEHKSIAAGVNSIPMKSADVFEEPIPLK